tara:strand:+ start:2962 stop:3537 length:576 start_codon:yes stop_codon:yes gene_type:complete
MLCSLYSPKADASVFLADVNAAEMVLLKSPSLRIAQRSKRAMTLGVASSEALGVLQQANVAYFPPLELIVGLTFVYAAIEIVGNGFCLRDLWGDGQLGWGVAMLSMGVVGGGVSGLVLLQFLASSGGPEWILWSSASFLLLQIASIVIGSMSIFRHLRGGKKKTNVVSMAPWVAPSVQGGVQGGWMVQGRF